ncbi:hypothetical protein J3F83DRAFT_368226 [Trichoderma novae-zelandiae]
MSPISRESVELFFLSRSCRCDPALLHMETHQVCSPLPRTLLCFLLSPLQVSETGRHVKRGLDRFVLTLLSGMIVLLLSYLQVSATRLIEHGDSADLDGRASKDIERAPVCTTPSPGLCFVCLLLSHIYRSRRSTRTP